MTEKAVGYQRLVSDFLGESDLAGRGSATYYRVISDLLGDSDAVIRTAEFNRLLTETMAILDSVSANMGANVRDGVLFTGELLITSYWESESVITGAVTNESMSES